MNHPVAPSARVPVVCNPRGAPDTAEQRIDTYRRLLADALIGRDRTEAGARLRFRADPGIEDRVRNLSALDVVNESVPDPYRRWVAAGGVFVTGPLVGIELGEVDP